MSGPGQPPHGRLPDPGYPRERFGPPDRRDKWWRRDLMIQLHDALERRDLSRGAYFAITAILWMSDDCGKDVTASRDEIGQRMGGRHPITVGHYTLEAVRGGWLQREHRCIRDRAGRFFAQHNGWRVVMPAAALAAHRARKAGARAKHGPTPRAPQNRPGVPAGPVARDLAAELAAAEALAVPIEHGTGSTPPAYWAARIAAILEHPRDCGPSP